MHRCSRMFKISSIAVLAFTSVAFAGEAIEPPAAESAAAPAATPAPTGETSAAPAPSGGLFGAAATTGEAPATPAAGETPVAIAAAPAAAAARDAVYGLAFRFRWISVPSWFLGMFTQKNVALSTYGYALEGFRRKRDRDDPNRTWEISAAIGYQNMSPPDGYWLGKGKDITVDTDLVQAQNFSLITMDAAFISRQYFSRYFGIHYGAGLGLAVVRGKIMRTSAVCNQATGECHVVIQSPNACGGPGQAVCTNRDIAASGQGTGDQAGNGHQFQETSIPGAVPIINLLFGLDFPVPDAKGLEFRVEGGFYDAFFIGGTAGYAF